MRYRGQGRKLLRLLAIEYTQTDPKYPDFKQTTQHFNIYTLEVDGGEIKANDEGEAKVVMKGKRKVADIYIFPGWCIVSNELFLLRRYAAFL
jgi:hypothetical protein